MSIKLKDTILDYIDKAYKDSSGNIISSTYLPLSGGTLTGNISINKASAPAGLDYYISDSHKASIKYNQDSNVSGLMVVNRAANRFLVIEDAGTLTFGAATGRNTVLHSSNYTDYTYSKSTIDTKLSGYLPLSGGAVTNNLTVSKSTSKDSTITPTTCILNIGTRGAGHSGYHTGIGFNALYYSPYSQHIHAWIGLGTYTTTATAECYPLVFATNESTTTNTAPIERMKIAPDGEVSITKSLRVGGYPVITSGNIGAQSVNYSSSTGSVAWSNVTGKPSAYTPESHTHSYLPLSGGTMSGNIILGSYGILGYGSSIESKFINAAAPGAEGGSVWLASTGGGGEAAGICLDGNTVSIWSPMDNAPRFIDSDDGKIYTILHSGNSSVSGGGSTGGSSVTVKINGTTAALTVPTSLPASDVYAWAKASTKPSYNFSEIGAGVATIGDGTNQIYLRTNGAWASTIYHHTNADEAVVFLNAGKNAGSTANYTTSWIFAYGTPSSRPNWAELTPAMQIKGDSVVINKLIGSKVGASYNLDVNGSFNATSGYIGGYSIITSGNIGSQSVNYASSAGSVAWSNVSGKPSTYTPSDHTHSYLSTTQVSVEQNANDDWVHSYALENIKSHVHNTTGKEWQYLIGISTSKQYGSILRTTYGGGTPTIQVKGLYAGNWTGWREVSFTDHTHTFANITSKPTTLSGYGITDAYTASTIDTKLSTYLPLSGGTMTGTITTPGNDTVVIKPAKNNYDQIGGEGIVFWKIFASNFYGTLQGNCTGSAGSINGHTFETVTSLPSSPNSGTVYFVTG